MIYVPRSTIEQIKSKIDIVDYISKDVTVKKSGKEGKCLCPFHDESTPSMTISQDKGLFHCFGCGKSGDLVKYAMLKMGVSFHEAVESLAQEAGVDMSSLVEGESVTEANKIFEFNHRICRFFEERLSFTISKEAQKYLISRGLNRDICKKWRVGYCPEMGELLSWCESNGVESNNLINYGIASKSNGNGPIASFFTNRVIFPIMGDQEEIMAFSARSMGQYSVKYINSPETPVFTKSECLYGIHRAKAAISIENQAIICEGQIDCITLHENGIRNTLALQGSAISDTQARAIKRLTDNVILCFDGDEPGKKASERATEIFKRCGLSVESVSFPEGEDPDSFVRKNGPEKFKDMITSKSDLARYARRIAQRKMGEEENKIIPTHIPSLNAKLGGGFEFGTMLIVCGQTSSGKSAFAYNVAFNAAASYQIPIRIWSYEMGRDRIIDRGISYLTQIPSNDIWRLNLTEGQYNQVLDTANNLEKTADIKIYTYDVTTVQEIADPIMELSNQGKKGILVVDYIQLIGGKKTGTDTREQQIARFSLELRKLAHSSGWLVIVLSQLNKNNDTRESAAIEHDADDILVIHHIDKANPLRKFQMKKRRDNDAGWTIDAHFKGCTTTFHDPVVYVG